MVLLCALLEPFQMGREGFAFVPCFGLASDCGGGRVGVSPIGAPNFTELIMDFQIASLCDHAADYNGKLVITGTFDTLAARQMPVVHPFCALALRICFTPEDIGRHKLTINIINEDGESLDPKRMPIEPEFEVKLPNDAPFLTRNIVMNLQGLSFPQAGLYSIDIGCDEEQLLVRLPLRIVEVKEES